MSFYRPLTALLFSVLLLEAAVFFHWYDMQSAVPKIRTLMPVTAETAAARPLSRATARAEALCLSEEPVWRATRSQMDYCMMSANAGDPAAQAVVAEFFLDGSTPASKAEAYAWLRTASTNRRDETVAAAARLRLGDLMRQLDAATLDRAETLAARYMRKFAR